MREVRSSDCDNGESAGARTFLTVWECEYGVSMARNNSSLGLYVVISFFNEGKVKNAEKTS